MATDPRDDPTLVLTDDERAERARIVSTLAMLGGSAVKTAASLGLTRRALVDRLSRYKIRRIGPDGSEARPEEPPDHICGLDE